MIRRPKPGTARSLSDSSGESQICTWRCPRSPDDSRDRALNNSDQMTWVAGSGVALTAGVMESDFAARQYQASCRSRRAWVAREGGFSIIDILMVVALIGIIAAIAVPVTGSAVSGQRFNND